MIRMLLAVLAALALVGCAATPDDGADNGYQFGDITGGAVEAFRTQQADYCTSTSPVLRAGLLIAIRARVPGYPPSGLCTDADKALADAIARRLADLPEGATVSLEQAREDQRRWQEQVDADADPAAAVD